MYFSLLEHICILSVETNQTWQHFGCGSISSCIYRYSIPNKNGERGREVIFVKKHHVHVQRIELWIDLKWSLDTWIELWIELRWNIDGRIESWVEFWCNEHLEELNLNWIQRLCLNPNRVVNPKKLNRYTSDIIDQIMLRIVAIDISQ